MLEFREFVAGGIGDRPIGEVALIPMMQGIAAAGNGFGVIAGAGRQHEDIDDMLARPVDERRDRLAGDQVEPAADQRKALRGESTPGGDSSVRPANHGLTVCLSDDATSVRWPANSERR